MKLFQPLYDYCLQLAKHPQAVKLLSLITFIEAIFFPIPPDVMLAPMALARPKRAWFLAALTTVTSILGGIVGYLLGMFLFDSLIQPFIEMMHYQEKFYTVVTWFQTYGVWVVFIAGFTPIPYKIFTVGAGSIGMALVPFLLASLVGRGARFFLVAGLMRWGGEPMQTKLREYIDILGWTVIILAVMVYFIWIH